MKHIIFLFSLDFYVLEDSSLFTNMKTASFYFPDMSSFLQCFAQFSTFSNKLLHPVHLFQTMVPKITPTTYIPKQFVIRTTSVAYSTMQTMPCCIPISIGQFPYSQQYEFLTSCICNCPSSPLLVAATHLLLCVAEMVIPA